MRTLEMYLGRKPTLTELGIYNLGVQTGISKVYEEQTEELEHSLELQQMNYYNE